MKSAQMLCFRAFTGAQVALILCAGVSWAEQERAAVADLEVLRDDLRRVADKVDAIDRQVAGHAEQLKNGTDFRAKLEVADRTLVELTPKVNENRSRLIKLEESMGEVREAAVATQTEIRAMTGAFQKMTEKLDAAKPPPTEEKPEQSQNDKAWERINSFIMTPVGIIVILSVLQMVGVIKSSADRQEFEDRILHAVEQQHQLEEKTDKTGASIDDDHEDGAAGDSGSLGPTQPVPDP